MTDDRLVDVEAHLRNETHRGKENEGAFLIHDGKISVWVPKNLVEHNEGIFTMPEWLAQEKGLI